MRPAAVTTDTEKELTGKGVGRRPASGPLPRLTAPLPKRRSWWPFRRQEPDIALRLLAVHMSHTTPRR